jgi:plastocyanin
MRIGALFIAAVILPAAACSGGTTSPEPPGTPGPALGQVNGTILDQDNTGINAVPVELRRSGFTTRNTVTGTNGAYTFASVEAGAWSLEASPVQGYEPDGSLTATVNVTAGGTATVSPLRLRRLDDSGATTINIVDNAFNPATITVPVGGVVRWVNTGAVTHNSTSATGLWSSPDLGPGGAYERTFNQAGSFNYACTLHPGMAGVIEVQ